MYREIEELTDFETDYGFLNSIEVKILDPKYHDYDFKQIEEFIKAPDNSPCKNGIFHFSIKEYVKKYAYKEFNNEYDYLFKKDSRKIKKSNLSDDKFTLTFFCIENSESYNIRINKDEPDKPTYYYIGHYISPLMADKALIVGNKVFHSSINIKECIKEIKKCKNSQIIFMIPMLEEFSYYPNYIKNK